VQMGRGFTGTPPSSFPHSLSFYSRSPNNPPSLPPSPQALNMLGRASAMEPRNPQARFQRANVLMKLERYALPPSLPPSLATANRFSTLLSPSLPSFLPPQLRGSPSGAGECPRPRPKRSQRPLPPRQGTPSPSSLPPSLPRLRPEQSDTHSPIHPPPSLPPSFSP